MPGLANPELTRRPPSRGDGPDDALAASLHLIRVAGEFRRAFELHAQGRFGLSPGRLTLLLLLDEAGARGLRPAQLADRARVSRPTVSRLLRGLEADALVATAPDVRDRRAVRVALTAAGRARTRALLPGHLRRLAAVTRALTPGERDTLSALLDKVRAGLDALRGA